MLQFFGSDVERVDDWLRGEYFEAELDGSQCINQFRVANENENEGESN